MKNVVEKSKKIAHNSLCTLYRNDRLYKAKTTRTVGSDAEDLLKKQELCLRNTEGYYPLLIELKAQFCKVAYINLMKYQ